MLQKKGKPEVLFKAAEKYFSKLFEAENFFYA